MSEDEDSPRAAQARTASVVEPARELIRHPSRAGIDDYGPALGVLEDWLAARALPHRHLYDDAGHLVALLVEIPCGCPGKWWTLDACVDTAPYGDEAAWSFPPLANGDVVDGSLLGRGSSDSKLAAAMFCHIASDLHSLGRSRNRRARRPAPGSRHAGAGGPRGGGRPRGRG